MTRCRIRMHRFIVVKSDITMNSRIDMEFTIFPNEHALPFTIHQQNRPQNFRVVPRIQKKAL